MKTPSSLITLGTTAGPSLTPGRAQTSHLLTVNDTYYVVNAGDDVALPITWGRRDLSEIGRRYVRLEFELTAAELFGFEIV